MNFLHFKRSMETMVRSWPRVLPALADPCGSGTVRFCAHRAFKRQQGRLTLVLTLALSRCDCSHLSHLHIHSRCSQSQGWLLPRGGRTHEGRGLCPARRGSGPKVGVRLLGHSAAGTGQGPHRTPPACQETLSFPSCLQGTESVT